MSASADVSVLLQALDGTWERCGSERAIKVVPESVVATANEWGADTASFDLRRSPIALWPDIGAFAPVVIEVGGMSVWKGRTGETPIKDGAGFVVSVQCKGMQYHLDDDVYRRVYVHTRLDEWKDYRSFTTTDLSKYITLYGVSNEDGALRITLPAGATVPANNRSAAIVLDLGSGNLAKRVVLTWQSSNNDANASAYFFCSNSLPFNEGTPEATIVGLAAGASGTFSRTLSVASRYLIVFVDSNTHTLGSADAWFKVTSAKVFAETSYESAGNSVLRASTIASDALDRATMLLSTDKSQIAASTFDIPDFVLNTRRTPREVIEAANAFHNWRTKIDIIDRLIFAPRPSVPTFEVGAWSGAQFEDSSANSGDEIYNKCIVEGQGPDATEVIVERTSGQQTGVLFTPIPSPAFSNPSFDIDASGWTVTGGALARDTVVFNSSPASVKFTPSFTDDTLSGSTVGTFKRGVTYQVSVQVRVTLAGVTVLADMGGGYAFSNPAVNTWGTLTISFTPMADLVNPKLNLSLYYYTGTPSLYVDDVALAAVQPTLVDRRGFRKTKVLQPTFKVTPAVGQQLADTFLAGHKTMPLKGSLRVTPGGCRQVLGGQPVHPAVLLTKTQELMRLSHRIDPDTGAVGRTGTIVTARYTHRELATQIELDDPRRNFDALLARLDVVQGAT